MAVNPNPSRITSETWRFWEEFKKIEPTVQLGGVYANKPGYHNARELLPTWDYSVQLAADKSGPKWAGSAIDLTFPDAQKGDYKTIAKYSKRLLDSGKDPKDLRGNYLREFYGNADLDTQVEGWDFRYVRPAVSDTSHLWHIHISFIRLYLERRSGFDAVLSILKGETYSAFLARTGTTVPPIVLPPVERSVLIQELGKPEVYITDGTTYRWIVNMPTLTATQAAMTSKGLYSKVIVVPAGQLAAGKFGKKV